MFETNPENDAVVARLITSLAEMPVGSILEYSQLNQVAGRDVQNGYRYLLMRARENAEKEYGCIFEVVRKLGIKRLNASESPEVGLSAIRKARRSARRGKRRLSRINSNSLSDTERKRILSYSALLGAIETVADGNKARTVAAVIDPAKPIPPESILEMFVK